MSQKFTLPRHPALRKQTERQYERIRNKISNLAGYTATALARAPKRVKVKKPENKKANNQNYQSVESRLFWYNKSLGDVPAGVTIPKYLKKLDKDGVRYRISTRHPGKLFTVFRKGSNAGSVPKSWDGPGRANYYISQKDTGAVNPKGKKVYVNNWQLEQINDLAWRIQLRPLGGKNSNFLKVLEHGGQIQTDKYVMGYRLFKTRIKSQNTEVLHFHPIWTSAGYRSVAPRPFVSKTLEKVRKRATP